MKKGKTWYKILHNGRSKNEEHIKKEVTSFTHWNTLGKNVSNHIAYKSLKDYTWGSSFTGIKFFSQYIICNMENNKSFLINRQMFEGSSRKNGYSKEMVSRRNTMQIPHKLKMCSMQIKSIIKHY